MGDAGITASTQFYSVRPADVQLRCAPLTIDAQPWTRRSQQ
jgi:hypothetical protein